MKDDIDSNNTFDSEINFRKQKENRVEKYTDSREILGEVEQLRKEAIQKRKSDRLRKNYIDDQTREHIGFKLRFKRWWFGMIKENSRIFWPTRGVLGKSFVIVVLLILFFVLIFFGLEQLFLAVNIIS